MSRWRAALIHLLISIGILVLFLAPMLLFWYPHPYLQAIGVDRLLMILIGVQVILGPCITLIIFRSGKPGLKFDLIVLGIAQFSALIYGASVIAEARPAFLVFAVDRFELVQAKDIDFTGARSPQFESAPWTGPGLAAAVSPQNPEKKQEILFSAVAGGADIQNVAELFEPYKKHAAAAVARAAPLTDLRAKGPETVGQIEDFLADQAIPEERLVYLPVRASKRDLTMILDKSTGEPLKALTIDPW
ncbi:MAG: TfpX/TfpZ family type IV pilin accessory protein [Candidatus Competibacteraceae bacterium]|jgi:hypothetical protein|nr:TfpX/TfpZ family type IV pilin accessory protein [Candidatus Competibacteraceae bacterium]